MRLRLTNGPIVAPEITGCAADARGRVAARVVAQRQAAARAADELLFRPASWLVIDQCNQVIPGVRPGTLEQALELVGRGPVASFFGRLRPGVTVVDIDLPAPREIEMELLAWCGQHGLWHLMRDSGRPGHRHLFIVSGELAAALETLVAQLRDTLGIPRSRLEVRQAVRPLCAPHRSGSTPVLPPVAAALRRLPRALATLPGQPAPEAPRATPDLPRPATRLTGPVLAAKPPPRPRRDLPQPWRDYLVSGTPPAHVARWTDQSRSAVEATATFLMATAGWSEPEAWLTVSTCHPNAMAKARSRGRAWWRSVVWNRAVADTASAPPPSGQTTKPPTAQPPTSHPQPAGAITTTRGAGARSGDRAESSRPEVTGAVTELHRAFLASWTRYGRDRRHTLRAVLEVICERFWRSGQATVPCPERDLVVDTGLSSRRILRAALHQLADDGWLVLHRSFEPLSADPEARSHRVSLPPQPPARDPGPDGSPGGLCFSDPPCSFTPLPPGTRHALRPELTHTWLGLPRTATPLPDIAQTAGLSAPGQAPTAAQLATLLSRLQRLALMGLAKCDENGLWHGLELAPGSDVLERGGHVREQLQAVVAAEREAYSQLTSGRGRWERQRGEALRRNAAAARLGAAQWWERLDPRERRARQQEYASRFARLSVSQQQELKDRLAARRAAAGVLSEESVRQSWLASLPAQEYAERVVRRTMDFAALPRPLQAAHVAAWSAHRAKWGLRRDFAPVVPAIRPARTPELELEQLDLLVLSESLERDPEGRMAGTFTVSRRWGRTAGGAG